MVLMVDFVNDVFVRIIRQWMLVPLLFFFLVQVAGANNEGNGGGEGSSKCSPLLRGAADNAGDSEATRGQNFEATLEKSLKVAQEIFEFYQKKIPEVIPTSGEIKPLYHLSNYAIFDFDNKVVGVLDYEISADKKTISEVFVAVVSDEYRGLGVASYLYAKMILDEPQVEIIKTRLSVQNMAVVNEAMASGATPEEAIKQSPHYRILVKLGYGKIQSYQFVKKVNAIEIDLVLSRT